MDLWDTFLTATPEKFTSLHRNLSAHSHAKGPSSDIWHWLGKAFAISEYGSRCIRKKVLDHLEETGCASATVIKEYQEDKYKYPSELVLETIESLFGIEIQIIGENRMRRRADSHLLNGLKKVCLTTHSDKFQWLDDAEFAYMLFDALEERFQYPEAAELYHQVRMNRLARCKIEWVPKAVPVLDTITEIRIQTELKRELEQTIANTRSVMKEEEHQINEQYQR